MREMSRNLIYFAAKQLFRLNPKKPARWDSTGKINGKNGKKEGFNNYKCEFNAIFWHLEGFEGAQRCSFMLETLKSSPKAFCLP